MNDRLYGTIETQITENNEISTVLYGNNQQVTTYTSEVPQIQTIIQAGYLPAVSVINAPFVEVTSVNGMTGDVITEPIVKGFEPNHYYLKDTIISCSGKLYCANETFTSGEYFDGDDWIDVSGSGGITNITSNDNTVTVVLGTESADLSIADTLENYVLKEAGKGLSSNDYTTTEKTKLDGIESGAQKNLPNTVIDASYVHTDNNFTTTLKDKLDGIESGAQKNVQANWTQTTTTAGDYIKNKPTLGSLAALNSISSTYLDSSAVTSAKIASGAVTNAKIASSAVKGTNVDWSSLGFQYKTTNQSVFTGASSAWTAKDVPNHDFTFTGVVNGIYKITYHSTYVTNSTSSGETDTYLTIVSGLSELTGNARITMTSVHGVARTMTGFYKATSTSCKIKVQVGTDGPNHSLRVDGGFFSAERVA